MEFVLISLIVLSYFMRGYFGSHLVDTFKEDASLNHYPEGATLLLYCHVEENSPVSVYVSGNQRINIVINSTLQEAYKRNYNFTVVNERTVLFTITKLQLELNNTLFGCQNRFLQIRLFNPIKAFDPRCSSSFGSRYIFEDLMTSRIELICNSEEGDPKVGISAYIIQGNEINDVTSISTMTESSNPYASKTLLFSSNLTSSFNNSVFFCNVSQQLPEPYRSYHGSCSFGPLLLLPSFSVSVIPSNITVNESDEVTLTCSSNVSEVTFDWSNIPSDWKTNINRGNDFSELHITDYGSSITSVILECVVTYGDRTITEHINISVVRRQGSAGATIVIICVLLIITITTVICLLVYRFRNNTTKCLGNITGKHIFGKNNSSKNNSNEDNNIGKADEKLRRADDVSSSLGGGTVMIDNAIYESSNVEKQNNEIEMTSTKSNQTMDQDCQMVENSIYESTSLNVEKQQSCVNPDYDTLQPDVHHI